MLHFVHFHRRNAFPVSTMHEMLATRHVDIHILMMMLVYHHFVIHFWDLSVRGNSRPDGEGLSTR